MNKNMQTVFIAYPKGPNKLSSTLLAGIDKLNECQNNVIYHSWESNDISGRQLISPIIENIEQSPFVVSDVTFLNFNVVFEIGFAIGCGKPIILIVNGTIDGDRRLSDEVGIFDTLGYITYENSDDLSSKISSINNLQKLDFNININHRAPVYIIETPRRSESMLTMVSRLKKAKWRYRSFNPSEEIRLSAIDAVRHVSCSAGVMIPLLDGDERNSKIHNIRAAFVSGLAMGMEKPALILHDREYTPPLDVRDYTKKYFHPDDIQEHIHEFSLQITAHLQNVRPTQFDAKNLLQTLSMGDPAAENEMTTLSEYYVPTNEFQRAIRGEVNLVVGRKGSGKTALFIQLRDNFRANRNNIVIDLRPEGYQLIKLKEDVLEYISEGAKQHLITAFWEYLLLLEVCYKILEKDKIKHLNDHSLTEPYKELKDFYYTPEFDSEGDFSERLLKLSENISQKHKENMSNECTGKLTHNYITNLIYKHDFPKLFVSVSKYLKLKGQVWILFDNLDKGWKTDGVDSTDIIFLQCLIDASRKLERNMRKKKLDFHSVVFIRDDVYTHLVKETADYGKEMRASLDWSDSDLLIEVLRKRLTYQQHRPESITIDQIWPKLCVSHYQGEATTDYFVGRSLMRPRNLLKIFNHCRGFSVNFSHDKIDETDIDKGMNAYSQDLLIEADKEITDISPSAKSLIYEFIEEKSDFTESEILKIIQTKCESEQTSKRILDFLIYYGIVGIRKAIDDELYIYNVNYNQEMIKTRARKWGGQLKYVINPAFWPALDIRKSP